MKEDNKKKQISGILILITVSIILLGDRSSVKSPSFSPNSIVNTESLLYSSYFGGTEDDLGHCIEYDSQGNIIIAGLTFSDDFPTTPGAYDTTYNGNLDIFISKWTSDGTELIFSTYLGGSALDTWQGTPPWNVTFHTMEMAVDSKDNIIIFGTTQSSDFPVTPDAYDTTYNGGQDLYVSKLAANGSTLLFSTFLGGIARESQAFIGNNQLILDENDTIYITGYTNSSDFPLSGDAYQNTLSGTFDIFISKLSSNGSLLLYSSYFGGSAKDYALTLALDNQQNILMGGYTNSPDYPITSSALDKTYQAQEAFITKFATNGTTLLFSTFLGGNDWDYLVNFIVDENNTIYCFGKTWSSTFPTTTGVFKESNGGSDAFVTKISSDGTTIIASTFLGGGVPGTMKMGSYGNLYVLGYTDKPTFPTSPNAYQTEIHGSTDFFLSKLTPDLEQVNYSTYFGGTSTEDAGVIGTEGHDAGDLVLNSDDIAVIIGSTRSYNLPVTANALDNSWNGNSDVFVSQFNCSVETIFPPTTTTITTTISSTSEGVTTITTDGNASFASVVISVIAVGVLIRKRNRGKTKQE